MNMGAAVSDSSIESGRDGSESEPIDAKRRAAIFTMGNAMTYAAPMVATFAMGGMSVREAHAYAVNQTGPV
jgi:hypothetical protein